MRAAPLALVLLTACITDPVTGRSVVGVPASDAEEQQMGLAYRPAIVQQYSGAYPDEELQRYLGSIVLGMARSSVRPGLAWRFTVLNNSVPNAFAVPGGQVFVTRGLLAHLDDEAEFAVVMGHEIGHVEHRHSIQSMGRDRLIGALGQIGGQVLGSEQLGGVAAGLFTLRFSRDQEREADVRGVHNSYHAGYDPRQGADVFRTFLKMKQESGGGESAIDAWTSSHPLDSERIANIEKLSAQIDPRLRGRAPVPELRVQTGHFAELIAKLRGEQKVYDRHDQALARAREKGGGADAVRAELPALDACARALPDHAYFANTLGKAYLAAGDAGTAKAWFERAAALSQDLLEPEFGLALIALEARAWQDAISHADRGLAILPDFYGCLYRRGEGLWNLGRRAEAQADFQRVMQSAPKDSEEYKSAVARLGGDAASPPAKRRRKR